MPKFRKKKSVVEAVQFFKDGDHPEVEHRLTNDGPIFRLASYHQGYDYILVRPGDWIITEPDGSGHYPCADSIFRETYEAIDE